MENNNIELLPWPAYSPDMNIIENMWAHIKDQVGKKEKYHQKSGRPLERNLQGLFGQIM
jgi:transposase